MLNFIENFLSKIDLKVVSIMKTLFYSIHKLNHFPINFKITRYDWRIYTKCRKEKVKSQT